MRKDGYKSAAVGALVNHWTRHSGDPDQARHTYRNQSIDPTRTHLNYDLHAGKVADEYTAVTEKIWELNRSVDRKPTAKTNVVTSDVVTLPRSWPKERDPREFFEATYRVLGRQVGTDNVVGAWVHMDETTPHMHFVYVCRTEVAKMTNDKSQPLRVTKRDHEKNPKLKVGDLKKDKKGTVKYKRVPVVDENGKPVTESTVSQSAMFPRSFLKSWHPETEKELEKELGFKVSLLLTDDEIIEKALSDVPQNRLNETRAAVTKDLNDARDAARVETEKAQRQSKMARDGYTISVRKDDGTVERKHVMGSRELSAERDELQGKVSQLQDEVKAIEKEADEVRDGLESLRRTRSDAEERVAGIEAGVGELHGELTAMVAEAPVTTGGGRGSDVDWVALRDEAGLPMVAPSRRDGVVERASAMAREWESARPKTGERAAMVRAAWSVDNLRAMLSGAIDRVVDAVRLAGARWRHRFVSAITNGGRDDGMGYDDEPVQDAPAWNPVPPMPEPDQVITPSIVR